MHICLHVSELGNKIMHITQFEAKQHQISEEIVFINCTYQTLIDSASISFSHRVWDLVGRIHHAYDATGIFVTNL